MLAVMKEAEDRMDLRFGILAAALINAMANPKFPVTAADVFPSLAPAAEIDPEELGKKIIRVLGAKEA